jgi:hypothetical protein
VTTLDEAQAATVRALDEFVDACAALDDAQAFYDQNAELMDDGPRAAAMAALAAARFAKVITGLRLIQSGVTL